MLFELATLPVEINASRRAVRALDETGILTPEELAGAKKVLTAAAMTYLAASFAAILTLLRFLAHCRKPQGQTTDGGRAFRRAEGAAPRGRQRRATPILCWIPRWSLRSLTAATGRLQPRFFTAFWRSGLRWIISSAMFSRTPVRKLSPTVREILRIGVYQIRYLEKIPPSAAVNECVTLAKKNGEFRAAGFRERRFAQPAPQSRKSTSSG